MAKSLDIIGDVHGQNLKLEELLRRLGYRNTQGAWRHPDREVRFVGDFIDRGPGQEETLIIVRDMIEAGSARAVMGNHELNAIGYATPDPEKPKNFLRIRGSKNNAQHRAFLDAVGVDSKKHKAWVDWFMTLPLWIDEGGIRLVHACWHPKSLEHLRPLVGENNTLTSDLLVEAMKKGTSSYHAVEALCKGMEVSLPSGVNFTDQQGIVRSKTRTRWWDQDARTYRSAALLPPEVSSALPDDPIPDETLCNYDNERLLFFGHYWMTGTPNILSERICCVDYSAAKNNEPLVAYQFDGESELDSKKLVAVGAPLTLTTLARIKP